MREKSFRFAFVSNSLEIAHAVRDYAATQGIAIEVRLATMEKALPVAQQLLLDGVDVILGGGGTGKLLRQTLERPVVTIARSHLDMIQALQKAKTTTRHIAITCYDMVPESLSMLAEILDVRVRPVPFTSTRELVEGIAKAVQEGVGCVVGGGVCGEIAHAQGCKYVVVVPGAEVIQRALEDARNIALSQSRDREQSAWLQGMVDVLHDGILCIDTTGKIATANATAQRLLGASHPFEDVDMATVVQNMGLHHALTTGRAEADSLQRVGGQDFVITTTPIRVGGQIQGAVASFRPSSYIRSMEGKLKAQLRNSGFTTRHSMDSIVGQSPTMRGMKEKAVRFASTSAAILIQGETGTGKELLAHALHNASPRCHKPFVALNCAALSESLLESELFGYDEGAFTGARRGGKDGLFVLANGGSIFLDEIGDIPAALQVRLLRVLEAQEIMRVGGDRSIPVNVRVISSTWKDLAKEVREGRFRGDLYYRLATLCLYVPPLRQRTEDMGDLLQVLLRRHGAKRSCVSERGVECLQAHGWSGNIRELDALIQRYVLLLEGSSPNDSLLTQLLAELPLMTPPVDSLAAPSAATDGGFWATSAQAGGDTSQPLHVSSSLLASVGGHNSFGAHLPAHSLKEQMEAYEKRIIHDTLSHTRFNRHLTAKILGISPNTLWRKLKG